MLPDFRDPVALTQALIRCRSVTPDEGGALGLIEALLEPRGFACHRLVMRESGTPDVDNLYARFGAASPHLCFAGHTDVVPPGDEAKWSVPPFSGELREAFVWGRGAVDMKGAIACFLAATMRHLETGGGTTSGSISFLITGDEEGPSINGTMKVLDWMKAKGEVMDAALVGEPTNPTRLGQEIKNGRRGSLNGEIIVLGKQGHAAYPQLAENPIPKLARIIDRLSSIRLDEGAEGFEASGLQVTVISAPNASTNVIPAEARAKFNIRYNTNWTRPRLEEWVKVQLERHAGEIGARYTVTFWGTGDVFLTKRGPLVDRMMSAVEAVTGRTPALTTNGGTSDARFIQAYCPVIEFGLTNALAHHVDERVSVADLEALTNIYQRFLAGLLTGSGAIRAAR